jgi:hypothetical protein
MVGRDASLASTAAGMDHPARGGHRTARNARQTVELPTLSAPQSAASVSCLMGCKASWEGDLSASRRVSTDFLLGVKP